MAETNKGQKLYIAISSGTTPAPQVNDLDQTGYEALTWLQVKKVGSIGETGTNTNVQSYDTLDTEVSQKSKGVSNAGDPVIELARVYNDNGQIAMRAAALTEYIYAFKIVDADKPAADYTDSIHYHRGIVNGPVRPNGRVEDFQLERFTLGLVQKEITVDPTPQSVPVNTVKPSISASSVAQAAVLTAIEGTWTNDPTSYTYQWQKDTDGNGTYANISGATSRTHTIAAGQAGDSIKVLVVGVNGAGSGSSAASIGTQLAGS